MSLNIQNATLYVFGIVINACLYVFQESLATGEVIFFSQFKTSCLGNYNLFRGFSVYTWLLVGTQSISGIFIGFVMKYANNLVRLFIISSATIATTVLSMIIFGLVLKSSFLFSAGLVIYAIILYHI